jgi:hypothetical protein
MSTECDVFLVDPLAGESVLLRQIKTIFAEMPACTGCAGAVRQFRDMYPNIQLNVFTGEP